jgi:hypothetical protein
MAAGTKDKKPMKKKVKKLAAAGTRDKKPAKTDELAAYSSASDSYLDGTSKSKRKKKASTKSRPSDRATYS